LILARTKAEIVFTSSSYLAPLLVRLAGIAAERGCDRMEWEVLDWNEPSIEFYRKLGAQSMDQWTKYRLAGEALQKLACEGG
jgi:ribosomal protein S18 acetylase RimI-like enzyme